MLIDLSINFVIDPFEYPNQLFVQIIGLDKREIKQAKKLNLPYCSGVLQQNVLFNNIPKLDKWYNCRWLDPEAKDDDSDFNLYSLMRPEIADEQHALQWEYKIFSWQMNFELKMYYLTLHETKSSWFISIGNSAYKNDFTILLKDYKPIIL